MYTETIGNNILHTTDGLRQAQEDFVKFTTYGIFIVIASAICVGMATRDLITDAMNDALLPLIVYFGQSNMFYIAYTKVLDNTKGISLLNLVLQKLGKLIWIMIVWVLTLYITYIVFQKLIRIDFITGKINFLQDVTRYFTGAEAPAPVHVEKYSNHLPHYV